MRPHVRVSQATDIFGRPFVKRVALCYQTVVLTVGLSCLSQTVYDIRILWPNGWMDQYETWHGGRPLPRPQCGRWGTSSPEKRTQPKFSPHVRCSQTASCIKMPYGTEIGLCPDDIVLDGAQLPLPKGRGHSSPHPNFRPICCGQRAEWIKMPWYRGRPRPRRHCVRWRWRASPSPKEKGAKPPIFGLCILRPSNRTLLLALIHMQICPRPRFVLTYWRFVVWRLRDIA